MKPRFLPGRRAIAKGALAALLLVLLVPPLLLAAPSLARAQPVAGGDAVPPVSAVAGAVAPSAVRYGVGVRMPRWVSVPRWFLGAFTEENEPLSTFGSFGVELLRRKADFDIVFGLGYQNMSPADGNWLGKGKSPSLETDFVQFRDLSLLGVDVSFIQRRMLSRYFGFHYGAGLGVALVRGEILRISNSDSCTSSNAGDERLCRPNLCPVGGCSEAMLRETEGNVDGGPTQPARFKDDNVPGAVPILHVNLGVDVRIPELRGFEGRLEGGFYNAFFLGLSFAYLF